MRNKQQHGELEKEYEEMVDIRRGGKRTRDSSEVPLPISLSRRGASCSSLRETLEGARVQPISLAGTEAYEKVKSTTAPPNDITTTKTKSRATTNDTALTDRNSL